MRIHAVQTGSVRIKRAQAVGRGHGLRRRLALFVDHEWTDWLPTFVWVIDHPEGVIVVDTGQAVHLLESGKSLPLRAMGGGVSHQPRGGDWPTAARAGIGARDVKVVVLTHLHMDHDGGLAHFPSTEIQVPRGEIRAASGSLGRMRGYLPQPMAVVVHTGTSRPRYGVLGPFAACKRMTEAGDVVAVATPGHTADHLSILVQDADTTVLLAGDASYDDQLLLDGVSTDDRVATATLDAIKQLAESSPTVYLPTHDPLSAARLTARQVLDAPGEHAPMSKDDQERQPDR